MIKRLASALLCIAASQTSPCEAQNFEAALRIWKADSDRQGRQSEYTLSDNRLITRTLVHVCFAHELTVDLAGLDNTKTSLSFSANKINGYISLFCSGGRECMRSRSGRTVWLAEKSCKLAPEPPTERTYSEARLPGGVHFHPSPLQVARSLRAPRQRIALVCLTRRRRSNKAATFARAKSPSLRALATPSNPTFFPATSTGIP